MAIILDGNRRFAKRLMLKPWKGHEWGREKIENVLEWCREYGIHELTLYVLSLENFNRPKEEFDYLMDVFRKEFDELLKDKRVMERNIRINAIGRISMLPEDLQKKVKEIMEKTKNNDGYIVNFAIAYGGRAEVVDAVRKVAEEIKQGTLDVDRINEEIFANHLYMKSEPDLIIRTAETRLSGFLLWQGSYSELIFLPDVLWPEFDKKHFVQCLEEYQIRQRRFGK
ncbi:MAG TPA: polyprenyl diphosphate synthase [Candidatus Nanoarchaeia archaeon]|nr:polyprenyl diphosphate synthase [Candidatus Nanoarchaeia archaeon]